MIIARTLSAAPLALLASCGGPEAPPFGDMLVDRFDVPECTNIRPLKAGGKNTNEGPKVTREYRAGTRCIYALERSLASMDFTQEGHGTFVAHRDMDWTEMVRLGSSGSHPETNVTWEEINP